MKQKTGFIIVMFAGTILSSGADILNCESGFIPPAA